MIANTFRGDTISYSTMRVIDSGASYIIDDYVYVESIIILVWTLYHVILSDWANHVANMLSGAKQALGIISRKKGIPQLLSVSKVSI